MRLALILAFVVVSLAASVEGQPAATQGCDGDWACGCEPPWCPRCIPEPDESGCPVDGDEDDDGGADGDADGEPDDDDGDEGDGGDEDDDDDVDDDQPVPAVPAIGALLGAGVLLALGRRALRARP